MIRGVLPPVAQVLIRGEVQRPMGERVTPRATEACQQPLDARRRP